MGLDTSHDAWHGAYGSFGHFRNQIAKQIGLIKEDEELYKDNSVDWEYYSRIHPQYMGIWVEEPEDPIMYLLCHADHDGIIHNRHLLPLANRLNEVLAESGGAFERWTGENYLRQFIDGLLRAYLEDDHIDFH